MKKFTVYSLQFTVWLRAFTSTVGSQQLAVNIKRLQGAK